MMRFDPDFRIPRYNCSSFNFLSAARLPLRSAAVGTVRNSAEAAVIAWLRHQTTAYDSLKIPGIKGKRREVRRMLAQRSQELLGRYRNGEAVGEGCPLKRALAGGK